MRLSVVIPTFKRPDALPRTLAALARQTCDRSEFEVLVVQDPGDPDEAAVAGAVGDIEGLAIRHLTAERQGASAARNVGWRAARAPLVLFIGDDIVAESSLVAEHLDWHDRRGGPRTAVLGHVRWASELRVTPFMRWLEHGFQFNYPAIEADEASWFDFYTSNVSVPCARLAEIDGFDEECFPFDYEDLDVGYRLQARGFRVLYNRSAVGEHLHPTTLESYSARMARVAAAEHRWVARHPELPAYFHDRLSDALAAPPARGRGRHLLRFASPTGRLGRRAWFSADLYYRQRLAPAFLEAWEATAGEAQTGAAAGRGRR
jgi:glycosyltransferase involved in cell wall biosynthesis